MDYQAVLSEVRSWPVEDRLRLIGEVWDGIGEEDDGFELTEELKELLDRRLEALDKNPDDVISWEDVEEGARERFRKRDSGSF